MKFRSDMKVDLVDSYGSDEMIARAARVSTNSDTVTQEKIKGLIGYLVRNGHMSPFAHVGATFRLEVPLFVRDQMVRHKFLDPNIQSFRFGTADPEFYLPSVARPLYNAGSGAHPDLVHEHPDGRPLELYVREEFTHSAEQAWLSYTNLLEQGVAEEVARGVLPSNTYSSSYWSANLWAWMNFIEKRIESESNKPQYEIQEVALQILEALYELFPVAMHAWRTER